MSPSCELSVRCFCVCVRARLRLRVFACAFAFGAAFARQSLRLLAFGSGPLRVCLSLRLPPCVWRDVSGISLRSGLCLCQTLRHPSRVSSASARPAGIDAGVARGVNGLCPTIELRTRGGRARGDGRRSDGPGMSRRPTGSSASAEKTQEDKGRTGW